jgi:hypothetical protein
MTRYSLDEIGDYLSQMSWPERLADVLKPRQREGAVHGRFSKPQKAPRLDSRSGVLNPTGACRPAQPSSKGFMLRAVAEEWPPAATSAERAAMQPSCKGEQRLPIRSQSASGR